jgi:GH35 family endo-1,4-beta-xylanase
MLEMNVHFHILLWRMVESAYLQRSEPQRL